MTEIESSGAGRCRWPRAGHVTLLRSLPLPPFANSAVDGYAVRNADPPQAQKTGLSTRWPQRGRLPQVHPVKPGHTTRRLLRGALMPQATPRRSSCRRTCVSMGETVVLPPGSEGRAPMFVLPGGGIFPRDRLRCCAGLAPAAAACRPPCRRPAWTTPLCRARRLRIAGFLDRRRAGVDRARRQEAAQLFDSNRFTA